jgi:hypothetical protein
MAAGLEPTTAPVDSPLSTGPFHAALRMAIRRRGLTLERLRCRLARNGVPVALSTLSDWQHGHRRPYGPNSVAAVRALEGILDLPEGSLIRLVVGPAAVRPEAAELSDLRPASGLDEHGGAIAGLLDDLPGARDDGLEILSRHDRVRVDADRRATVVNSRTVVRARRDGVDRYALRYFGDEGCRIGQVQVRPEANCRLGEVRRHRDPPVLVAELVFGAVLRAGETWVFEEDVVDHTGGPCVEHGHGFTGPQEQYLLEVRFHPRTRPARCRSYAQPGLHDERRHTAELRLNAYGSVHLLVRGVSAGLVGIAWEW